jgi:hypothetical protein
MAGNIFCLFGWPRPFFIWPQVYVRCTAVSSWKQYAEYIGTGHPNPTERGFDWDLDYGSNTEQQCYHRINSGIGQCSITHSQAGYWGGNGECASDVG